MVEETHWVHWQRPSIYSVQVTCWWVLPATFLMTYAATHQAMAADAALVTLKARKAPGVWKADLVHFIDLDFRSLLQAVPPEKRAQCQEWLGQASVLSTYPV